MLTRGGDRERKRSKEAVQPVTELLSVNIE